MRDDKRKVVLVGVGMVGASYAYTLLNQNLCDELVLIDVNRQRAEGEAMDLNHGLALAPSSVHIYAGAYSDCQDADLVVLCAGVPQNPGESRLELLRQNADIYRQIIPALMASGFHGLLLVAVNPVDVMTRFIRQLSGLPESRVFGSGTVLDTARLRFLLGRYFQVDPRNIHAYVVGEHGDSGFVPWSQAMVAVKPVKDCLEESGGRFTWEALEDISRQVRDSAQAIIQAKGATYYGIGIVLARITRAVLEDENSVLTLSAALPGGLYAGMPCIVNRQGVRELLNLPLSAEEKSRFEDSLTVLGEAGRSLH